jgi:hypothetical protein
MSQVAISGNASGAGVFTIAAPNSNNNYTLTLPTQTSTLATTADITSATTGSAATASDITGVNTTATVTSGTTAMTVGSATNIVAGMYVVAQGITPGTTVSTIVGTAVTLSANANATLSAAPVTFYSVVKLVTPGSIGGQTCRAWVNFAGSATAPINAAFNVSSITVVAGGQYTVNFTATLTDANYTVFSTAAKAGGNVGVTLYQNSTVAPTTSACQVWYYDTVVGHTNPNTNCYVSFFR